MRHRVLVLACGLAASALAALPANANVLVKVDKSTQQMTVLVDGQTKWVWPVSTGRPGRDTPSGTFHAFRMDAEHFSREFDDAPMPHSIFFTQVGHAIHGYYNTRNIGLPASHGCVRLDPANATRLFTLVKEQGVTNTTVEVTGNAAIALANHRAQLARAETPAAPAVASAPQPIYAPQSPYAQQTYPQQTYAQPSYAQPSYPQTYGSSSRDDSYASGRQSGYSSDRQSSEAGYASAAPVPPPGYPPFPRAW
jgi:hypothetical protein